MYIYIYTYMYVFWKTSQFLLQEEWLFEAFVREIDFFLICLKPKTPMMSWIANWDTFTDSTSLIHCRFFIIWKFVERQLALIRLIVICLWFVILYVLAIAQNSWTLTWTSHWIISINLFWPLFVSRKWLMWKRSVACIGTLATWTWNHNFAADDF